MFAFQVLPQLIIALSLVKRLRKCQKTTDGNDDKVDECLKADGLHQFFSSELLLWFNIILAMVAIVTVVCKKVNQVPLSHHIGVPCWIMQTIGLSYVAGYLAATCFDAQVVLLGEIASISLAILASFFGGKLLNYT